MSPHVRGRMPDGTPNPIDVHVGRRIRLRRFLLGMSQERLGEMLGMSFQQVQKYERGANRIGASRLWDISIVLKCPVAYFYDDMPTSVERSSPRHLLNGDDLPDADSGDDSEMDRHTFETFKRYYDLPEREQAAVDALIRTLSKTPVVVAAE